MLKSVRLQPDADVVARCRELLELAESGEVVGLAVITINQRREIGECFCGTGVFNNVMMAIGALETLKARLLLRQVELP